MNRLLENNLINFIDDKKIDMDSQFAIARIGDNKFVIAQVHDARTAIMSLLQMIGSKELKKLIRQEDLFELKDLWEYTFNEKLK